MGVVVKFPRRRRRHGRASAGSAGDRAARAVKRSAVTPHSAAVGVSRIFDHQSAGMLSLCHHLETAYCVAPISAAKASLEGQSSMTALNDLISDKVVTPARFLAGENLGQLVLKSKAKLSYDLAGLGELKCPMPGDRGKTQYKQEFIARVAHARWARELTQAQMASLLDIPQDRYKQYETRSFLPHAYITKFCLICMIDHVWLYTGAGRAPAKAPPPLQPTPKRTRRRRKPARAA